MSKKTNKKRAKNNKRRSGKMNDQINNLSRREKHYKRLGRQYEKIAHFKDTFDPHLDAFIYSNHKMRDQYVHISITGGMSDVPQKIPPAGIGIISPRTEVFIYTKEMPQPWVMWSLRLVAEYPFRNQTFINRYHSIESQKIEIPQPDDLTNYIIIPPFFESPEFCNFDINGQVVNFLWVIPIKKREVDYVQRYGARHFYETAIQKDPLFFLNFEREPVV